MDKRTKVNPMATMATRHPGGVTLATPVAVRGVVKVAGKAWPFICGSYYVLATQRSVMPAKGPGPRMASEVERANVEALLNAPITEVTACNGKDLRSIATFATDQAEENQVTGLPITVGGEVFNLCELTLPASLARATERVVIGRADEMLRVDGETFRFALMKCVAEPMGELGGMDLAAMVTAGDA